MRQFLILAPCRCGSPDSQVEAYQAAMGLFAQGIYIERAPRVIECAIELVRLRPLSRQTPERTQIGIRQPLPLREDPGFLIPRQEIAAIQRDGALQQGSLFGLDRRMVR